MTVTTRTMRQILSQLVISEATFQRLGPALNSGTSIFMYGPPGNGKTSIARAFGNLVLSQVMYIPYALYLDGQVIKVLPRGSQLIVNEANGENKIGLNDQWLQVVDEQGANGFVLAGYVRKTPASEDPRKQVDQVMQTLEYFTRTELVRVEPQGGSYVVSLTQKGRYMADMITSPSQGTLHFGAQKINLHSAAAPLVPHARRPTAGNADLCLRVDDGIEATLAHLADCGVMVEQVPVIRTGALGPMQSVYFRDPDGNLIELAHYPAGA